MPTGIRAPRSVTVQLRIAEMIRVSNTVAGSAPHTRRYHTPFANGLITLANTFPCMSEM